MTTLTAPLYVDRLWTVRGNVSPVLPRGYSFMGCVDGILYAMTDSPVFDPAAGLAALAELVRLADLPWQPPMPVARAQAIQASAANAQRLMRGQLLPLAIALLALAVVPMVISVVRSLLP